MSHVERPGPCPRRTGKRGWGTARRWAVAGRGASDGPGSGDSLETWCSPVRTAGGWSGVVTVDTQRTPGGRTPERPEIAGLRRSATSLRVPEPAARPHGRPRRCAGPPAVVLSAARDRADDAERLGSAPDGHGEEAFRRFVREVASGSKEADVRPPVRRAVIPDRAPEHRMARLEFVEYRRDRRRPDHFEADLAPGPRERPEVCRQRNPDLRHGIVCTSTECTRGRCSTTARQLSPSSGEA